MKKRKNAESNEEKARQGCLVDIRDHLRLFGQAVVDQFQGGLTSLVGVDSLDHVVLERLCEGFQPDAVIADMRAKPFPAALG